jgi:hypothetical protein
MSALGQKRTCAAQKVMSALPPIATLIANFECPLRAIADNAAMSPRRPKQKIKLGTRKSKHLRKVFSSALTNYHGLRSILEGHPMITEIASVVGGCVFAGLTMICVAQFFRSKYPPSSRPPRN